ncbi:MAG: SIMPL domain-containing protein [Muribaculaceae bacterium]|jgi:uncharacterized protein|nr:SIMPL domain-containing protein [Muribaculaceae bacterium]
MKCSFKETWIVEAAVIAVGVIILGLCIKGGIDNFVNKDRKVTVKGLAEMEVQANKVTWPIVCKEVGNDLPELYTKINDTNTAITKFLKSNGISDSEISINAPVVLDMSAERYDSNRSPFRYNITSVITVSSTNVPQVRKIIARQGELLKQGIAIVAGEYENPVTYSYTSFNQVKSKMMQKAIENAQVTANQFASNSHSTIDKIISADQGQFTIDDRDANSPYIKELRVVTTITYSLKN